MTAPSRDALGRSSYFRGMLVLILGCLIVRAIPFVAPPAALVADPDAYRQLAGNLVAHHTFGFGDQPTAYRPPLYPLVLTSCVAGPLSTIWRIAGLHYVLGLITLVLVWQVARRWLSDRGALLAAALVACDPLLLNQSAQIMTETLAALLAVLVCWAWIRTIEQPTALRAALCGIALGLAVLCRPTFLPWLVAAPATLLIDAKLRQRIVPLATMFVLAALLTIAPWAIRNQAIFGRPIVGTTHGGYTLWLGNNPEYYEHLRREGWQTAWHPESFRAETLELAPPPQSPADELANDRRLYRAARTAIENDPAGFIRASVLRIVTFWGILPKSTDDRQTTSARALRIATGVWYGIELPLAVLGLWRLRSRLGDPAWLAMLALALCFTAVHTFYWTDLRMRAPLMPLVAVAAAQGCAVLGEWAIRRNPSLSS